MDFTVIFSWWQLAFLSIFVALFCQLIKKLLTLSVLVKVKNTKYYSLFLALLPIAISVPLSFIAPMPDQIVTIGHKIMFGFVAGITSGWIYKIFLESVVKSLKNNNNEEAK